MTTMDRSSSSGMTGSMGQTQTTHGEGAQQAHTHPATVHTHDDYHVSHHHKDGMLGEWEHRTFWHTHEHNHASLTHSHDYSLEDEQGEHAKEAHVHDHEAPAQSHT